jgi:alpha-L-fucosidase
VYAIYLADEKETAMPAVITIKGWTPKPGSKAIMPGTQKTLGWKAIQGNTEITIPAALRKNPPSDFAWVVRFE